MLNFTFSYQVYNLLFINIGEFNSDIGNDKLTPQYLWKVSYRLGMKKWNLVFIDLESGTAVGSKRRISTKTTVSHTRRARVCPMTTVHPYSRTWRSKDQMIKSSDDLSGKNGSNSSPCRSMLRMMALRLGGLRRSLYSYPQSSFTFICFSFYILPFILFDFRRFLFVPDWIRFVTRTDHLVCQMKGVDCIIINSDNKIIKSKNIKINEI